MRRRSTRPPDEYDRAIDFVLTHGYQALDTADVSDDMRLAILLPHPDALLRGEWLRRGDRLRAVHGGPLWADGVWGQS